MAERKRHIRHEAFETAHPAVPAFYLVLTLALTMFSLQPVLIALALAGGFVYGCRTRGVAACLSDLRWQAPLILLIAVVNPLFSASGSTVLMHIGPRAVYAESICYGATMGGLFVASMLWFRAAAAMVPFDHVMALAGNAAPVLALMISMTMRLIPRFLRQGRLVAAVQDAATVAPRGGGVPRRHDARASELVRRRLRLSTVLMGWGMEDALEMADAMRVRGWGAAARRSTYTRFRFTAADGIALAGLALGGALCVAVAVAATSQFAFYPVLSHLRPWWGYLPFAAWMLVPTVLQVIEEVRYR